MILLDTNILVHAAGSKSPHHIYLSSHLWLIVPKETTASRMLDLIGSKSVKGGKIFDCFLAATMLDNGVQTIYTENTRDFEGLAGIEASNPFRP